MLRPYQLVEISKCFKPTALQACRDVEGSWQHQVHRKQVLPLHLASSILSIHIVLHFLLQPFFTRIEHTISWELLLLKSRRQLVAAGVPNELNTNPSKTIKVHSRVQFFYIFISVKQISYFWCCQNEGTYNINQLTITTQINSTLNHISQHNHHFIGFYIIASFVA